MPVLFFSLIIIIRLIMVQTRNSLTNHNQINHSSDKKIISSILNIILITVQIKYYFINNNIQLNHSSNKI